MKRDGFGIIRKSVDKPNRTWYDPKQGVVNTGSESRNV